MGKKLTIQILLFWLTVTQCMAPLVHAHSHYEPTTTAGQGLHLHVAPAMFHAAHQNKEAAWHSHSYHLTTDICQGMPGKKLQLQKKEIDTIPWPTSTYPTAPVPLTVLCLGWRETIYPIPSEYDSPPRQPRAPPSV